jgi:hypothetical protein
VPTFRTAIGRTVSRSAIGTTVAATMIAAAVATSVSACGFIAAGNDSSTKPSSFVLTGQAAVALPSSGNNTTVGSPCQAPAGATDVAPNVTVTVTDASGAKLATGRLGAGVVTGSGAVRSCSFPFQITRVPGNVATYRIAVGNRPPQDFSGNQLRHSTAAVVTITGAPAPTSS